MSDEPLKIVDINVSQFGDCWTNNSMCGVHLTIQLNRKPTETEWENCEGYISIFDENGREITSNRLSLSEETEMSYIINIYEELVAKLPAGTHNLTAKVHLTGSMCDNTPIIKSFQFVVKTYSGKEENIVPLKPVSAEIVRTVFGKSYKYWLRIHFNRTIGDTDYCTVNLGTVDKYGGKHYFMSFSLISGKDYIDVGGFKETFSDKIVVNLECWASGCGTCGKGEYILYVNNPYLPKPQPSPAPPETQEGTTTALQSEIDLRTTAVIGGALGVLYFLNRKH